MDLSTLSRAEKIRLLEVMEEVERRKKEKGSVYSPNEGQRPVHLSKAEVRAVFSGNGAGKSAMAVNEAFWALKGYCPLDQSLSPVPTKVIVVLDNPEKIREVWLPEIQKWWPLKESQLRKNGKPYYSEICLENGSTLSFMFHLQESLAFESIEADFFIFDEPPPRHIWTGLRRAGRRKNRTARYLFIGTPLGGSWMREEFYDPWRKGERSDIECFKFGTRVNEENLADGYIEKFSSFLTEKERRVRLEGDFFDLDGLALASTFSRSTHLLPHGWSFDLEGPCVVAIDPHPNKKHVAILLGADRDGGLYCIKEFANKLPPRLFARELKTWYRGYRLIDIVCDSLGATPMSGGDGNKSFIDVLKEEGIQVRSTTYEGKNDEDWLMRIQDALLIHPDEGEPTLKFSQEVPRLIHDVETVSWVRYKNVDEYKPKLDIGDKDFLACLKYALATNLSYEKMKAKMFVRNAPATAYGQRRGNLMRGSRGIR